MKFQSTKQLELGSCAFRQPNAANNRAGAGENSGRCSYIHGYRLKAKFWFGCSALDDKNWVQDFGGFKHIKEIFKNQFDHTTCLSFDDPLLPLFKQLHEAGGVDLRIMENGTGIERIAEFCFNEMQKFVHTQSLGRVWVERVEVFEHEDNSAIYSRAEARDSEPLNIIAEQSVQVEEAPIAAPEPVRGRAAPLYCKTDKSLADILAGR